MNTLKLSRMERAAGSARPSGLMALVAGLAVGWCAVVSMGQPGGAGAAGGRPAGMAGQGDRGNWLTATISVDFAGGTLAEYVAGVRAAAGDWAVNVAFTDGADRLGMPAVSFRNVQLETALRAMAQLATARGGRVRVSDAGANPANQINPLFGASGAPMFVVSVERPRDADMVETMSRVLSLASLTTPRGEQPAAMTPDVVLSAIEAATQNETSGPPSIRYHRDSGLLFVTGTRQQVELAVEVLARLESDAKARQRGSGKAITETFNLAHTPATSVVDVLRTVFPQAPDQPARVTVQPNAQSNSAVVSAPEEQMMAVRALLRYIDIDPARNPAVAEARAEREAAARQAEMMAVEAQRVRDLATKSQEQMLQLRADAETSKVRAEEMARLQEAARQQAEKAQSEARQIMDERRAMEDRVASRMRELESQLAEARQTIEALRRQLGEAGKPK